MLFTRGTGKLHVESRPWTLKSTYVSQKPLTIAFYGTNFERFFSKRNRAKFNGPGPFATFREGAVANISTEPEQEAD